MKPYTIEELKNEFKKLGYIWFNFHIIGIRSKADLANKFDDYIILIEGNNITYFTGTTNPGVHWLQNLLNLKGSAVLKPNQYIDTWKLDLHQGKYLALCQRKPVVVYRDSDKDDKSEETNVIETGLFGINIHRSNPSAISTIIDKWSAGCQVLNNPTDFNYLIKHCQDSGLKDFTYTLLKETV